MKRVTIIISSMAVFLIIPVALAAGGPIAKRQT